MSSSYFKEVLDVPQEFLQWVSTHHRLFRAWWDTNICHLSFRDGKNFINRCTKPDKREFLRISQAVGVGFVVMGVLGYFVKLCRFGSKNNCEIYGNWLGNDFSTYTCQQYISRWRLNDDCWSWSFPLFGVTCCGPRLNLRVLDFFGAFIILRYSKGLSGVGKYDYCLLWVFIIIPSEAVYYARSEF